MINASINTPAKISVKSLVIGDVSKRSLGLDAVNNTSDLDKPISNLTQAAIDLKADQATTYTKVEVDGAISSLIADAPGALDTLNELAAALGDDANFATNITNIISNTNENIGIVALDVSLNTDDITTNAENIVAANEAIEANTGAIEDNAAAIATHASRTNNPHGVTALQIGVTNNSGGGEIGLGSDSTTGGAAGYFAKSTNGFAGGDFAKAQGPNRVQLGTGTNSTDSTIQFLGSGSITAAQFGNIADIADNAAEIAIVKSLNVGTLFFLNDGTTLGSFASGQLVPSAVPNNAVRADIGHAVTILGNSAFSASLDSGSSLNILAEVTIPTSVTEIQNSVFAYQKLTNIDIPNSVTSIGSQSFKANLLESLSISGSVTSIGNSAFKDNLLTAVTFAESLLITKDSTGDIVVVSGAGLSEANGTYTRPVGLLLTLQYELKDIGGNVLYEIQRGPFYEYWRIVRKSDSAIIYENDTLNASPTQTTLPLTGWSTALVGLPSIAGLTIGASAFENNLITELNIGTSVNIIGASAFRDNDFTSIVIPSTVTSIGTSAFAVNTNLNTVYAFCPISAFSGTSIFANTVSALTIVVSVDDNSWDSLEALNPSSYQGVQAVTIQRIALT